MSSSIDKKIATFFLHKQWKRARQLIIKELKMSPEDHWLLTRLSTTYYEEKNYKKALEISKKAKELAPQCPLVLWDFAGALDMVGNHKAAIKIWEKILSRGVDKLAYDDCGEGIRWARSLLNDCRYRIGLGYYKMNNFTMAIKHIQDHIKNRKRGLPSIYRLPMVKKKLAVIKELKETS